MTKKNRHPADRLADARKAKKAAEKEESDARDEVLAAMGDWQTEVLEGEEVVVTRDPQTWKGNLDPDLMTLAGLNPDEYRKPSRPVSYVKTTKRKNKGEPVWPANRNQEGNNG